MTNRQTNIQSRRAFTITEVLIAISILTIFLAAAGELFKSSMLLGYNAPRLTDQATRTDSALFQLRRDVWNASDVSVAENKSVDLETSDGKIVWKIGPEGDLTRTGNQGQSEQWKAIAQKWSLAADGSCLTMQNESEELRLPSQVLLAKGAQP